METKAEARRRVGEAIAKLTEGERARASAAIAERVLGLEEFRSAKTVMVFLPMADEVDTWEIARRALAAGKGVCAPKVVGKTGVMEARVVEDLERDVEPGVWGIPEPVREEQVAAGEIDFVLVPGLAFDRRGGRLGRGAGYYDRFLSKEGFRGYRCAVGFACQVEEEVPMGEWDVRVECVVTEEEVIRVGLGVEGGGGGERQKAKG